MDTFISHSPEETVMFGERWACGLTRPTLIGLSGDLGAGKTQLVRGLVRGLGSPARVHSPTFTLINEYAGGRLPVCHLDLYRLHSRDEVVGAGLESYLVRPAGIVIVEWIEKWGSVLPGPGQTGREGRPGQPGSSVWGAHLGILEDGSRQIEYHEDPGS
jgi:tRNA threonylcarbamoyladenosine biosynthesis protein TsaE